MIQLPTGGRHVGLQIASVEVCLSARALLVVLASAVGHQMGVVARRRIGYRTRAPGKQVAQVVGELLQFIGTGVAVVPEEVVVGGSAGALHPEMRHQEEISFGRMDDVSVDHGARWDVTGPAHAICGAVGEHARVVTLLHHQESDERLVTTLQSGARPPNGRHLLVQDLGELALADTVAVENDALRLARRRAAVGPIEAHQDGVHHILHVLDRLLARFLEPHLSAVAGRSRVQTAHHGSDRVPHPLRWIGAGTRVGYIRTHNHHLHPI